MAVAPEPYLSACMTVLRRSMLNCRAWGWSGEVSAEHIADLMDAVHNIPELVVRWERCDVEFLRTAYLLPYQQKWAERGGLPLCRIFDSVVARSPDHTERFMISDTPPDSDDLP